MKEFYPPTEVVLSYGTEIISWGNEDYLINDDGSVIPQVKLPPLDPKSLKFSLTGCQGTFNDLPTDSASLSIEADEVDNTVYGQFFSSSITGLKSWDISFPIKIRKSVGYKTTVKRTVSSVPTSAIAMDNLGGGSYRAVAPSQEVWDIDKPIIIFDSQGVVNRDNILQINPLIGKVVFRDTFSPSGDVFVNANVNTLVEFGCIKTINVNIDSEVLDYSCFSNAKDGFRRKRQGLKNVSLESSGFYLTGDNSFEDIKINDNIVVEVDIEGNGYTMIRGNFRVGSVGIAGAVGEIEDSSIAFLLNVKEGYVPFSIDISEDSALPQSVKELVECYTRRKEGFCRYSPYGYSREVYEGNVIVTNLSFTSSVADICSFSIDLEGVGKLNKTPTYLVLDNQLKKNPEFVR